MEDRVCIAVPHCSGAPRFPNAGELWFVTGKPEDAGQINQLGYPAIALNVIDFSTGINETARILMEVSRGASIVLVPNYAKQSGTRKDADIERKREHYREIIRQLEELDVRARLKEYTADSPVLFRVSAQKLCREFQPIDQMPTPEDIDERLSVDEPPVDWLIPGVLVRGKPGFIGGGEKCLKTSIAADLAASLATGSRFLGHFPAPEPTRVLFVSGESGGRNINDLFRRIKDSRGIGSFSGRLNVIDKVVKVDSESGVEHMRSMLTSTGAKVLVVDPLYLCVSGDGAENMMIQGQRIQPLVDVCNDLGVTLLLVHHTKQKGFKSDRYAPAVFTDLAWAGWAAFARQWIMVGRREAYDYEGRHNLWLNIGGNDGHSLIAPVDVTEGVYPSPRIWKPEVLTVEEAESRKQANREQKTAKSRRKQEEKRKADLQAAKDRIISKLREVGEPMSKSAIGCIRTDTQSRRRFGSCPRPIHA
ncbi:AAA family ATPase [Stieleria magnilauensis]